MALFNKAKREINAKIVLYGPPHSGKSTSLQFIHKKLKPEFRSKLKMMGSQKDRMIFFDFTAPDLGELNGFRVRLHLYAIQGEVSGDSAWKTVLKGADGIMFVADASPGMASANLECFEKLGDYLQSYGQGVEGVPTIVLCNKNDLPGAISPEEVQRSFASPSLQFVSGAAERGEGVLQALSALVKMVLRNLREESVGLEEQEEFVSVPVHDRREAAEETSFAGAASTIPPSEFPDLGQTPVADKDSVPVETPPAGEEPTLEISGKPELTTNGSILLPLTVRAGVREKRFTLTIALTEAGTFVE